MTTGGDELHIKSIIVGHNSKHNISCTSSGNNTPAGVTKSSSSSFKRVSFGSAKGTVVETYIYERVPTVEEGRYGPASPVAPSPATPSRVKVTSSESQAPVSIAPPAAVGSAVVTKLDNTGGLSVEHTVQRVSPPLPSLQKMEEERDNPFRPDGQLSHEVDPIVESYKTRPFPLNSGPDGHDGSATIATKSPTVSPPVSKKKEQQQQQKQATKPQDIRLTMDGYAAVDVQHKQLASPKAGRVEVVHIESKKKRCGCCSIQ